MIKEYSRSRLPKRFSIIVTYPPKNKSLVISFGATDTVYHVTKMSLNQFGLKENEQNQYILRYANEILDPLAILSQSKIPESAEFLLEPAPDIIYPYVYVKLIDREEGCVNGAKFRENENLWKIAQQLLSIGKYVNENRMELCHENHRYVGRKELERTTISSLCREKPQVELTLEPARSNTSIKEKSKKKKATRGKKVTASLKKKKQTKIKESNESKQIASIRSKLSNADKAGNNVAAIAMMDGVVYLGSREGIAYKTSKSIRSQFSLSSLHSHSRYSVDDFNDSSNLREDGNIELCINFPEGISLKAIFHPHERIADVQYFIRPFLKNPEQQFYLYTVSPRLIMPLQRFVKDIVCLPPYHTLYFGGGISNHPQKSFLNDNITKSFQGSNLNSVLYKFHRRNRHEKTDY